MPATPDLKHPISRAVRAYRPKAQVERSHSSWDQGTEIEESDCEAEVQPGEISDPGFGKNSTRVCTQVSRISNDHESFGTKTRVAKPATRPRRKKLPADKMRLEGFLVTEELVRQEQKDKETRDDEVAKEKTWQPAHPKPVVECDISGYDGKYDGQTRKIFRTADILDVLHQKNPRLAAPALIVGIYVGGGLAHPRIHFVWLWELKDLAIEGKVGIQERLKKGERWVIDGELQVMTPECIDKPAEVKKHTVAKDVYFNTTTKDLRLTTELAERLRILLLGL